MREQIIKYILNNQIINDYLNKVQEDYRDDFRSFIWLEILELYDTKPEYVESLYIRNELGKFITGIIRNQLKSSTSKFYKQYKDNRFDEFQTNKFNDFIDSETIHINTSILIVRILAILNRLHPRDAILFKLYYGIDPITSQIVEPLNYTQIGSKTGITYRIIKRCINQTTQIVKKEINL